MDFTREPVIETVITPKEGCKLVVRSSKSSGQEEYFVDALEVVSFGHSLFFRSQERPKAFLVPVSDYEILEVREARMVLKNVGADRSIKIGGGRETPPRLPKEIPQEREAREREPAPASLEEVPALAGEESSTGTGESTRLDKKRGRRHYRRRRGRDDTSIKDDTSESTPVVGESESVKSEGEFAVTGLEEGEPTELTPTTSLILSSILPPPPTLISETIARYKDNAMFKGAFFVREEKTTADLAAAQDEMKEDAQESGQEQGEEPHKEAWISDEAEEEIFRHRAASLQPDEPFRETPADHHESADAKEGSSPTNN